MSSKSPKVFEGRAVFASVGTDAISRCWVDVKEITGGIEISVRGISAVLSKNEAHRLSCHLDVLASAGDE